MSLGDPPISTSTPESYVFARIEQLERKLNDHVLQHADDQKKIGELERKCEVLRAAINKIHARVESSRTLSAEKVADDFLSKLWSGAPR